MFCKVIILFVQLPFDMHYCVDLFSCVLRFVITKLITMGPVTDSNYDINQCGNEYTNGRELIHSGFFFHVYFYA